MRPRNPPVRGRPAHNPRNPPADPSAQLPAVPRGAPVGHLQSELSEAREEAEKRQRPTARGWQAALAKPVGLTARTNRTEAVLPAEEAV